MRRGSRAWMVGAVFALLVGIAPGPAAAGPGPAVEVPATGETFEACRRRRREVYAQAVAQSDTAERVRILESMPECRGPADAAIAVAATVAHHWYGWQILINDAAAVAVSAATAEHNQAISYVASAAFFLGSPVIHGMHHRTGTGLVDHGLRVALPTGGFIIGAGIGRSSCTEQQDGFCGLGAVILGMLVGVVVAEVIDVGYLAREDVTVHQRPPGYSASLVVAPYVTTGRDGFTAGFAGRF